MSSLAKAPAPRAASRSPAAGLSPGRAEHSNAELRAAQDSQSRSVDLSRVTKLLEGSGSRDLEMEQLKALKKVVKHFEPGLPLKDLAQVMDIVNLCADKVNEQEAFTEPLCQLIRLCGLPFLKKKFSDEMSYSETASKCIAQLGYLMRVPSSRVRTEICQCVVSFYDTEPPRKLQSGYQPTSANYKIQMAELAGLAETLVLSLALVENQLLEKLWVLRALQHLSSSGANCRLMLKAQAASRLCLYLGDADPSGLLLLHSSDILCSLLENTSREEVVQQLSSLECVYALKAAFVELLLRGPGRAERQLRNDLLVLASLVAAGAAAAMLESGFAKLLVVLATFTEAKIPNPLLKGLKLTNSPEDFEMKKLLFNVIGVLSAAPCAAQLLRDSDVMPALLSYIRPSQKPGARDWSAAQYEELQLHAMAVLASVAPVLVEKFLSCQANTLLLLFLEWCLDQDAFSGQGNSFHARGGRGSKLAQMRYGLRVLRSVVPLCHGAVSLSLCDQGAISQLLDILKYTVDKSKEQEDAILLEIQADLLFLLSTLCDSDLHRKELFSPEGVDLLISLLQMDPRKIHSGVGHNHLLFTALDCLWSCVLGCPTAEDSFLQRQGIGLLLDLLALKQKTLCNTILGILVEFCDNPKTTSHISSWRGEKEQTAGSLLLELWRQEELELGVRRDPWGRIVDMKQPMAGSFQRQQEVVPLPATCPSFAIMEVSENTRAKLYCLFCKLGFGALPGLSAQDFVTLAIVRRYLDFKVAEVWSELCEELKGEFKLVRPDEEALRVISEGSESIGRMVAAVQAEVLDNQQQQEIQEEERTYARIKATQKQKEMVNRSWESFLARTSSFEALKKVKRLQEKSVEAPRLKSKPQTEAAHSAPRKGLGGTPGAARLVAVGSTPGLTGGALPAADLALGEHSAAKGALNKTNRVKRLGWARRGAAAGM